MLTQTSVQTARVAWRVRVATGQPTTVGDVLRHTTVRALCAAHLARYKCPRQVLVVDELPRNTAGKVLKRELRQRVR